MRVSMRLSAGGVSTTPSSSFTTSVVMFCRKFERLRSVLMVNTLLSPSSAVTGTPKMNCTWVVCPGPSVSATLRESSTPSWETWMAH